MAIPERSRGKAGPSVILPGRTLSSVAGRSSDEDQQPKLHFQLVAEATDRVSSIEQSVLIFGDEVVAHVDVDRSDLKNTVCKIRLDACIVHAEWNLEELRQ